MKACVPTRCVSGKCCDMRSSSASRTSLWYVGLEWKSSQSNLPANFSVSQRSPSDAQSRMFGMMPCAQSISLCWRPTSAILCSTMMARQRTSSATSKSTESVCMSGTTAPDSKKARMNVSSRNSRNVRKTLSCNESSKNMGSVMANHEVSRMKKRCAALENSSSMPHAELCPMYSKNSSRTSLRFCLLPASNAWILCCSHSSPGV
mmetsp:Transcript_77069/g.198479  ORF Transcript_77069/g.198479 Transcript_77069/m.198479 type:complete len:205 (-) Transcript_77069:222-836(-)